MMLRGVRGGILTCALALCALGAAYQVKGNLDLIVGQDESSR